MSSIEKNPTKNVSNNVSNGISSQNLSGTQDSNNANVNGQTTKTTANAPVSDSTNQLKENNNTNGDNNNNNGKDNYNCESLKIIGHIRNIEKINEKRRIFLTNTLSESVTTTSSATSNDNIESTAAKTTTTTRETREQCETKIDNNTQGKTNDVVRTYNHETFVDKTNGDKQARSSAQIATLPPLKSPLTPPPKPPMLSRTRSLGVGDQRSSSISLKETPSTPMNTPITPTQSPTKSKTLQPKTVATFSAEAVVEPAPMKVLRSQDSAPLLRAERPMSIVVDTSKNVSVNHYERLIEELKCPGCAKPMKAPVILCQTGHSLCNQCTRILMMCPLCKEPFTTMRSRTVEALCAKAHFRCCNAAGGCTVRLQNDLLSWHEKQCIYKPMKCFMGRVWGDCQWTGREAHWKDHLEEEHSNRLFKANCADLVWNMGPKQKPLTGYYVFDIYDELFNFYEIYDKDRVLFTMTCTSSVRERKHHFAYEVTIFHQDNEALAITQKFPVHSEYDKDILSEGTCVSIPLSDLAKFIDEEKLLHYRVRLLEVKTPRKVRNSRYISQPTNGMHPIDFQQSQIEGVNNLKCVPSESIVTRKLDEIPFVDNLTTPTSDCTEVEAGAVGLNDEDVKMRHRYYSNEPITRESSSESDPEFEAYIAKKWGTPQMNFNRKYLKNASAESASSSGDGRSEAIDRMDDKLSVTSRSTSYTKKMTNSLRKSFRSLKTPIAELKPLSFVRRSPEKKSP